MRPETKCPHANIIHCPLYVASHAAIGIGCDDGGLADGGCAVDRGMDYVCEVAKFRAQMPREVAMLEWNERAEQMRQQRARNMRAAGVH